LGSLIHKDPLLEIKVSDLLSDCRDGLPMWDALKVDLKSGVTDIHKVIIIRLF